MRAVDLIPPDERRGDRAPTRTGVFTYVLVGGLALMLLGILALALTSKQIKDRQAEKQTSEQELVQATARAQSLQAFIDFRRAQESRAATVASLAKSRFDWERVLNELALILPSDVWLKNITGTVSPSVTLASGSSSNSGGSSIRSQIAGPALEIEGCATGQDAVAGFVASLEDIDGVTRVGLSSSASRDDESGGSTAATGTSGSGDSECFGPASVNVVTFQLTVAFDAAPTPGTATSVPSLPPATSPPGADQSQVADGQEQQAVQAASTRQQTTKAQNAVANLTPGG